MNYSAKLMILCHIIKRCKRIFCPYGDDLAKLLLRDAPNLDLIDYPSLLMIDFFTIFVEKF